MPNRVLQNRKPQARVERKKREIRSSAPGSLGAPGGPNPRRDDTPSVMIIKTIDGVDRFEDDGSDPVEWLEAHDTGEPV